eukprot:161183-Prymnesium_polylepis.1
MTCPSWLSTTAPSRKPGSRSHSTVMTCGSRAISMVGDATAGWETALRNKKRFRMHAEEREDSRRRRVVARRGSRLPRSRQPQVRRKGVWPPRGSRGALGRVHHPVGEHAPAP